MLRLAEKDKSGKRAITIVYLAESIDYTASLVSAEEAASRGGWGSAVA